MTSDIYLRQTKDMTSLIEASDDALEAACGGLLGGSPTLGHTSQIKEYRSAHNTIHAAVER
jgi:hypothetical protein